MKPEILQKLRTHCKFLARNKLRFIANNDHSLDLEDLEHDLLAQALTAAGKYTDITDLHLLNICKKSAHNHMIRLIEHHTAQKRSRIVESGSGYMATTLSLDKLLEDGMGVSTSFDTEDTLRTEEILSRLLKLPEPIPSIVTIVLGGTNLDFEVWLAKNNDNRGTLEKACDFYDVPLESLQAVIRTCEVL